MTRWLPAKDCIAALFSQNSDVGDLFADDTEQVAAQIGKIETKLGREIYFSHGQDDDFPKAFSFLDNEDKPRFLFACGNLDLLGSRAVGICGSRHASQRATNVASEVVGELCKHNLTIVSGYAGGIDRVAHSSVLSAGGNTIVVLPEGLSRFSVRRELKDVWDWQRVLVLSQFDLNAIWRPWNAMLRNRTIMAISDAMLVVEARLSGGTFDAGKVTLKYGRPLFAVQYDDVDEGSAGNQLLVQQGAVPLRRSKDTGRPSIGTVLDAVSPSDSSRRRTA